MAGSSSTMRTSWRERRRPPGARMVLPGNRPVARHGPPPLSHRCCPHNRRAPAHQAGTKNAVGHGCYSEARCHAMLHTSMPHHPAWVLLITDDDDTSRSLETVLSGPDRYISRMPTCSDALDAIEFARWAPGLIVVKSHAPCREAFRREMRLRSGVDIP